MNKFKVLFSLVLIGMLLLGYVGEAQALPPTYPSGYYGKVQFVSTDPDMPVAGDYVDIYVSRTDVEYLVHSAEIKVDGTDLVYAASVPGDDPDTTYVEGAGVNEDMIFKVENRVVAIKKWIEESNINLNLHPPLANAGGPYTVAESSSLTYAGSVEDLYLSETFTYAWDFDYQGGIFTVDSTLEDPTHTYSDNGTYTAAFRVTDINGGISFQTATVTVNDVAPTALTYTGQTTGSVGVAVNLSASATCASVDTCTFTWDLDNDSAYDDFTGSSTTYTWNESGEKTIGIKVTDDDDSSITTTATITISLISQNISLETDWNLVSFSLIPADTTITSVLSSIANKYTIVYGWDGSVAAPNNWLKYDPASGGIEEIGNTLDNLDNRMGFWIKMTEPATLAIQGTMPTVNTQIPLYIVGGGWNLVSYPSTTARAPRETLPSSSFTLIYAYHKSDTSDPWKLFDNNVVGAADYANDLTQLTQGWGYWVKAITIDTWSVPY